jgi:hypothetical protein
VRKKVREEGQNWVCGAVHVEVQRSKELDKALHTAQHKQRAFIFSCAVQSSKISTIHSSIAATHDSAAVCWGIAALAQACLLT